MLSIKNIIQAKRFLPSNSQPSQVFQTFCSFKGSKKVIFLDTSLGSKNPSKNRPRHRGPPQYRRGPLANTSGHCAHASLFALSVFDANIPAKAPHRNWCRSFRSLWVVVYSCAPPATPLHWTQSLCRVQSVSVSPIAVQRLIQRSTAAAYKLQPMHLKGVMHSPSQVGFATCPCGAGHPKTHIRGGSRS